MPIKESIKMESQTVDNVFKIKSFAQKFIQIVLFLAIKPI